MSQSMYKRRNARNKRENEAVDSSSESESESSSTAGDKKDGKDGASPSERNFQMAGPPGTKLAQEIHDEFLVCKICLEGYKNPKSLNCLHTFCEGCIEQHVMSESTYKKYTDYREFTCPLCRKRTQLPIGGVKKLPDNFLVSSLSEIVTRQRPSKFPFCDICKMVNRKHREAQSKCLDCAKLLCAGCVQMHRDTKVTSNHSIFDVEIEKDIECHEHQDEVVRFYCEPCEMCICVLCTFNEHKDHDITQFGDAVIKYKENIQGLLDNCKDKITTFDDQLETLSRCEDVIKGVEQQVHDTAIKYIQEIRQREKQMVEELQNLYGSDVIEMIENKKELTTQVDSLRSTCNLTEVILKGKDIELLLLKKDVQEKLSTLNTISMKPPPATVNKIVNYMPGQLDLGFIQDLDRPMLTKMRLPRIGSQTDHMGDMVQLKNMLVQTDEQGRTKDKKRTDTTTEDESDSEDDDDDDDDESEEESDSDDEKPEMKNSSMQTEDMSTEESSDESVPEMADHGTMTDAIKMEDKGVNTRSRSLQSISTGSAGRHSPIKEGDDNSLAARRRRRRERALTTTVSSMDMPDSSDGVTNDDSHNDRRQKRRSAFYNHSMDEGDVFYDAADARGTANRI